MKKFFQKVRLDSKFRNAGEGHRLTDEPSHSGTPHQSKSTAPPTRQQPMSESQANAAIAAIQRSENKKPVKKPVKLPEDKICTQKPSKSSDMPTSSLRQGPDAYSVEGVKFISALTNEIYCEAQLSHHYKECLILKLGGDEKLIAACQMIHTLNKDRDQVIAAISTINRYIDNITAHENEEKYRKIRKENKMFSEKVSSVDGGEEFLIAAGFVQKLLPNASQEEEIFFVLPNDVSTDTLKEAKELLSTCKPLLSKLYRDTKVYRSSDRVMKFHLPDSFYNLSSEEIKREQTQMTEDVELSQQLRTKAMREKPKSCRKYKYALLRVKFPDGYILQGTFGAYEKLEALKNFVRNCLNIDWVPFNLVTSLGKSLDQEDIALLDLSLVPYAALNLAWLPDVQAQLHEQGMTVALKDELLSAIQELS